MRQNPDHATFRSAMLTGRQKIAATRQIFAALAARCRESPNFLQFAAPSCVTHANWHGPCGYPAGSLASNAIRQENGGTIESFRPERAKRD
ncbi:hypothetical protein [Sphingobium yanoikuyae]|uniref:hypothetical protein n=1 Tax=Sphingobium yanoikuyae TaxID=13690 RepID=UPI0015558024|nr:hypothetical protein [Sphingobium yanoikuyae]